MLSHVALNPDGRETIVLLHALGEESTFYTEQGDIPSLLSDFHFLVPDLPGTRQSQHTRFTSFTSAADQVQELIVALARDGRAHVVGFDIGGLVALTLAQLHPANLLSCIAINPEIETPPEWPPNSLVVATAMAALVPLRLFPSPGMARSAFYAGLDLSTDPQRLKTQLGNLTYRTLMDYAIALREFRLRRPESRTLVFFLPTNRALDTLEAVNKLRAEATLLRSGNPESKLVVGMWKVEGSVMRSERFAAIIRSWITREGGARGSPQATAVCGTEGAGATRRFSGCFCRGRRSSAK